MLTLPPKTQRAYFAGFFDAEGSISINVSNPKNIYSKITFCQTKPDVPLLIHSIYGGKIYFTAAKQKNWRPQIRLDIFRFGQVGCFLQDIYPYLGEKLDQVNAVLTRYASRMPKDLAIALSEDISKMKQQTFTIDDLPPNTITHIRNVYKNFLCIHPNCSKQAKARSLCPTHYVEQRLAKTINVRPRNMPMPFTYKQLPSEIDLAYIAGFFDGEGHMRIDPDKRNNKWHIKIGMAQTRPHGLLRISKIYGGTLSIVQPKNNRRRILNLQMAQHEMVMQLLKDIQPFCIEKREQINHILTHYTPTISKHEGEKLHALLKHLRWETDPLILEKVKEQAKKKKTLTLSR